MELAWNNLQPIPRFRGRTIEGVDFDLALLRLDLRVRPPLKMYLSSTSVDLLEAHVHNPAGLLAAA